MEKHLSEMTLMELIRPEGIRCSCGKVHKCGLKWFKTGSGIIRELPDALRSIGTGRPFVVMDENTEKAAGFKVRQALLDAYMREGLK